MSCWRAALLCLFTLNGCAVESGAKSADPTRDAFDDGCAQFDGLGPEGSGQAAAGQPIGVLRGDLILRGELAVEPGDERYLGQRAIAFFQAAGRAAGVYAPFWGDDATTWDDTRVPLGRRVIWTEIEIATHDGEHVAPGQGAVSVVLRPTASTWRIIDKDQVVQRYAALATTSTEPLVGLFLKYIDWSLTHNSWIAKYGKTAEGSEIVDAWAATYGIDFRTLAVSRGYQYSPWVHDDLAYTDLADARFWQRDFSGASRAAWALTWGWYQKSGAAVRDGFAGQREKVAAVDAVFPGALAAWLVQNKMVEIVDAPAAVVVRIRQAEAERWAGSLVAKSPASGIDVSVEGDASGGDAQLRVYCDEHAAPRLSQQVTLPLQTTLPDLCDYPAPGTYVIKVELSRAGVAVATDRATVVATPATVAVHRGDLIVWLTPATRPDAPSYLTDAYLGLFSAAGDRAGVYQPFFDGALSSWDDTTEPLGRRAFSGHVEIVAADDPIRPVADGFAFVVLRPTTTMAQQVDLGAAADRLATLQTRYNQPFVGIFLRWLKWADTAGAAAWPLSVDAARKQRWKTLYGFDLDALPAPQRMQPSPEPAAGDFTDIRSPGFWRRDTDCSSAAMWSLIWGWHHASGDAVAEVFANHLDAVGAIDALSPGQVARWLVDSSLADVP